MWRKTRRIPPDTFRDLHILLKTGINPRKPRVADTRLRKWTSILHSIMILQFLKLISHSQIILINLLAKRFLEQNLTNISAYHRPRIQTRATIRQEYF